MSNALLWLATGLMGGGVVTLLSMTVEHNGWQAWHYDIMPFEDSLAHKAAYTSFRFHQP